MRFLIWKLTQSCGSQHSKSACQLFPGTELAYKGNLARRTKLGLRGVSASGWRAWLKTLPTQRSKSVSRGGHGSISQFPMISSIFSFRIDSVQSKKHSSSFWGQSLESLEKGELLLQASHLVVPCYYFAIIFSLNTSLISFIWKGCPSWKYF